MSALIFRPARNAMQSGKGKSNNWVLVHEPDGSRQIDPLMGYSSSSNMNSQIRLTFDSLEEAKDYASRQGLAYRVEEGHDATSKVCVYTDNFKSGRKTPWTH